MDNTQKLIRRLSFVVLILGIVNCVIQEPFLYMPSLVIQVIILLYSPKRLWKLIAACCLSTLASWYCATHKGSWLESINLAFGLFVVALAIKTVYDHWNRGDDDDGTGKEEDELVINDVSNRIRHSLYEPESIKQYGKDK